LVTLPKNFGTRVLGSIIIQPYAGEGTPSIDWTLGPVYTWRTQKLNLVL